MRFNDGFTWSILGVMILTRTRTNHSDVFCLSGQASQFYKNLQLDEVISLSKCLLRIVRKEFKQ